ncbi:MAG TPA: sugar phosphate isomerase/epimerase [Bryobacteraceae bacterium]|nr:sugar phosphate isomerase/epimerase [Bryobacteraceae bacterium]
MSTLHRRDALKVLAGAGAAPLLQQASAQTQATQFQLACMTLPYAQFPLERALTGIASAGYKYVAWGTTHQNSPGRKDPIIAADAPASEAKSLADRCRSLGLQPVMLFSQVYVAAPDSVAVHTRRIEQAAAAGIKCLLTFGSIKAGEEEAWIRNLKQLAPIARASGVTVTIKQHGGNTATGADCARIVEKVADPGVKMCYDAGNVLDYNNNDPIADIQTCWKEIRAFCIKDHRNFPKDEDCGPGFGEIDHYKLLTPVLKTGFVMPLAFENIFEPLVRRPTDPAGVDALARRSREYIESVLRGLQQTV